MNYLAHLYLSGDDEKVITGNFIGDYVKGKNYNKYPESIKKGILLHRQIDFFTDSHQKFREAKKLLVTDFGLYSGIVIDLFYDHFLAANWNSYSNITLRDFSKKVHSVLLANFLHLPARVQGFLPSLIKNRRLESYSKPEGIEKSLEIMSHYTTLPDKSKKAAEILQSNHSFFHENFSEFMKEIIAFVETEFQTAIQKPNGTWF